MRPEWLQKVNTGRLFVRGLYRSRAVLDVDACLETYPGGPGAIVALALSGDGWYRDPVTLDVEEAALLADAISRAMQLYRSGVGPDQLVDEGQLSSCPGP